MIRRQEQVCDETFSAKLNSLLVDSLQKLKIQAH